jgi:hypothetical protein
VVINSRSVSCLMTCVRYLLTSHEAVAIVWTVVRQLALLRYTRPAHGHSRTVAARAVPQIEFMHGVLSCSNLDVGSAEPDGAG